MVNNYYQKQKEKFGKKTHEKYQIIFEEEKEKSVSVIVNVIRTLLRNKSKSKLSM